MNSLLLYRISGWCNNLTWIFVTFLVLRSKKIWKDHYKYLAIVFIAVCLLEILASVSVITSKNNLFVSYLYIPIEFSLLCLYLQGFHRSKPLFKATCVVLFLFLIFQTYIALNEEGYKKYNSLGIYVNTLILLFFALWNLTILFKQSDVIRPLKFHPDFWFTGTILAINVLDLITSIIFENNYISGNAETYKLVGIIRNFTKIGLMYGYVKGIRLLG